jgi:hypothetical protein
MQSHRLGDVQETIITPAIEQENKIRVIVAVEVNTGG